MFQDTYDLLGNVKESFNVDVLGPTEIKKREYKLNAALEMDVFNIEDLDLAAFSKTITQFAVYEERLKQWQALWNRHQNSLCLLRQYGLLEVSQATIVESAVKSMATTLEKEKLEAESPENIAYNQLEGFFYRPDELNLESSVWQSPNLESDISQSPTVATIKNFLADVQRYYQNCDSCKNLYVNSEEMKVSPVQKDAQKEPSSLIYEKTVALFYSAELGYKRYCVLLLVLGFLQDQLKDSEALLASLPTSHQIANGINATDIKRLLVQDLKFEAGEIHFDVTDTNVQFSIFPKRNWQGKFNQIYLLFIEKIKELSDQKGINIQSEPGEDLHNSQAFTFFFPSNNLSVICSIVASINEVKAATAQQSLSGVSFQHYNSSSISRGSEEEKSHYLPNIVGAADIKDFEPHLRDALMIADFKSDVITQSAFFKKHLKQCQELLQEQPNLFDLSKQSGLLLTSEEVKDADIASILKSCATALLKLKELENHSLDEIAKKNLMTASQIKNLMELAKADQHVACNRFNDLFYHPEDFNLASGSIWQSAPLASIKYIFCNVQFYYEQCESRRSLYVDRKKIPSDKGQVDQYCQDALTYERTRAIFYSAESGYKRYCVLLLLLDFLQDQFKDSKELLESLPTSRQIANVINATDIKKLLMSYLKFKTGEIQFDVTDTNIQFSILPKPNRDTNFNRAYRLFVEEIKKISDQKGINIESKSAQGLSSSKAVFKFSFSSDNFSAMHNIAVSINKALEENVPSIHKVQHTGQPLLLPHQYHACNTSLIFSNNSESRRTTPVVSSQKSGDCEKIDRGVP